MYLLRLDLAGDAIGCLLEALQALAKADGVLAGGCASPVQQQGQQLVLGQVGNRLRSQGMHLGPRLSLDAASRSCNSCLIRQVWNVAVVSKV